MPPFCKKRKPHPQRSVSQVCDRFCRSSSDCYQKLSNNKKKSRTSPLSPKCLRIQYFTKKALRFFPLFSRRSDRVWLGYWCADEAGPWRQRSPSECSPPRVLQPLTSFLCFVWFFSSCHFQGVTRHVRKYEGLLLKVSLTLQMITTQKWNSGGISTWPQSALKREEENTINVVS